MIHPLNFILYFMVGVFSTILGVIVLRLITKEKALLAAVAVFVSVLVEFGVLVTIMTKVMTDIQSSWVSLLVYAFGIAVGTFLGIKFKFERFGTPTPKDMITA
ncbi:MAG: hypothetical protein JWN37_84 [Candidatus Nomurabacteria bacterium]|nr:hypothetical protein [Candidatus Nomurabacteria bacterium]